MRKAHTAPALARALLSAGAGLMLAACGGSEEEATYEADATDVSGGEPIVTEETPAVPVDVPDTAMTPVPADEAAAAAAPAQSPPAE